MCRMIKELVGSSNLAGESQKNTRAAQRDLHQGKYIYTSIARRSPLCMIHLFVSILTHYHSEAPASPAVVDVDLLGFYPSLSRDGAVVSE